MKPSVYLETTIIGYLAMRWSNLLQVAALQQMTRDWWDEHRDRFDLYVSKFTVDECLDGDPAAAAERHAYLEGIPWLEVPAECTFLADMLLRRIPLPAKAQVDSLHIAVAAVNGIEYLLTWNCKHIANAAIRERIESICRQCGYEAPTICTPQELMEQYDEPGSNH